MSGIVILYILFGRNRTKCRRVGIGRRGRLKICCWQQRAGSSPAAGMIKRSTGILCFFFFGIDSAAFFSQAQLYSEQHIYKSFRYNADTKKLRQSTTGYQKPPSPSQALPRLQGSLPSVLQYPPYRLPGFSYCPRLRKYRWRPRQWRS